MRDTTKSIQTDGPVFIVTGASSGIGRALALHAARAGYRVAISARRVERLDELATQIRSAGGAVVAVPGDVRDATMPQRLVQAALDAFGRIDVVANIAGMGVAGTLLDQSDAAIEAQWDVHVAAPLRISRAALPHLRKSRGSLVFIGSGLARVPVPRWGAYPAVKAAIRAAAIQLRRELRHEGVAVTYVDPGAVATEFNEAAGMEPRANSALIANANTVAKRILHGIRRRVARVNAVPYQTVGVVLGEWLPGLADRALSHIVAAPKATMTAPVPQPGPPPPPAKSEGPATTATTDFERALEPVARRMERVKLSPTFVRELLVSNAQITLHDAAMRWAGMPNKNERAAMHEVLGALTDAGFLSPTGDESWTVVRTPD